MESTRSAGAASWPLVQHVFRLLLLLGCGGVQSISPSFIARPTKWLQSKAPQHKVSKVPPPAHPWAGSGLSERVLSAGSLTGALFHVFVEPVLSKAPIINTTSEATPLRLWGAGQAGSNHLLAARHDNVTDELAREVKLESEHRRHPNLSKTPTISVGLSHASSSHVRSPGSTKESAVAMQDAELKLIGQLLRDAKNFFAFEGSLVPTAVGLSNLHHIHAIEANAQILNNLLEKPEVQNAIHEGKLVLTGPPAPLDGLDIAGGPPVSCTPGEIQGAFEADWDLIFMGKECSTDAVKSTLEATSLKARVAVFGQGAQSDSYDKVGTAGSLTVFVRKNDGQSQGTAQSAEQSKTEDSSMGLGDALAPLMHGEGVWPH